MSFLDLIVSGGAAPAIVIDAANTHSSLTTDASGFVTEGGTYTTAFKFVDAAGAAAALKTDATLNYKLVADASDLANTTISIMVGGAEETLFTSGSVVSSTYGSFNPTTGALTLNALSKKVTTGGGYSGVKVATVIKTDSLSENGEQMTVSLSQTDSKFVNSWYVAKTVFLADPVVATVSAPKVIVDATLTGSSVNTETAGYVTEGNTYTTTFKFVDPASTANAALALKTGATVNLKLVAGVGDLGNSKISVVENGTEVVIFDSSSSTPISSTIGSFNASTGALTMNASTAGISSIKVATVIADDSLPENGEQLTMSLSQTDSKLVDSWYVNKTVFLLDKVAAPIQLAIGNLPMTGAAGVNDTFVVHGTTGGQASTMDHFAKISGFEVGKDVIQVPDTGTHAVTTTTTGSGFTGTSVTTNVPNPILFANLGNLAGFTEGDLTAALVNLDGLDTEAKNFVYAIELTKAAVPATANSAAVAATTDTYLLVDSNQDGIYQTASDLFVKLVGVGSSSLNTTNFVDA